MATVNIRAIFSIVPGCMVKMAFHFSLMKAMQDGSMSTGLVAAVPLEYIVDFLSLEDEEQLMYYHIIRSDGSFVIQNPHTELGDFFKQLQKQPDSTANELSEESSIKEFGAALKKREEYVATVDVNGEEHQIYGIPLPYSEWYLVSVMPYSILDDTINNLSNQRIFMTLLSCAITIRLDGTLGSQPGVLSVSCLSYNGRSNWLARLCLGFYARNEDCQPSSHCSVRFEQVEP